MPKSSCIFPRTALAASLASLALLGACAAGPDFAGAAPPAVDGYAAGDLPTQTMAVDDDLRGVQRFDAGAGVPAQWWLMFGSEELDRAVAAALESSPTIAQARARLAQAQQDYAVAFGGTLPAIDVKLDATRQLVNVEALGFRNVPSPPPFTLFGASVQVSYTLDLFGAQRRELEGLQAAVDYQRFELEAARLSLAANVATTAIREASLRAQIADTTALAAAQREQVGIGEQRYRAGGIALRDVQRQRGELAQTQALLPGLAAQLAATRHRLAVYLGVPPEQAAIAQRVPEFHPGALRLPDTVPLGVPSRLARQRPDIRAAEALLHQASANIGVATANLYPQLTLTGSAGTQALAARDLFDSLNVWSLAAGLVQPVFRGGALRAQKRAAEAAYEQSLAAYRQTVLQGLQDVGDTLRALESDAGVVRARTDAHRHARDTLGIVTRQYQLGGVAQIDVLDAQRQYRQAALDLAQAEAQRLADTVALLQALGGGWWRDPPGEAAAGNVKPGREAGL